MNDNSLLYNIALTLLPGVGSITAKNLLAYCGSAEEVFSEKKFLTRKIPGVGTETVLVNKITNRSIQKEALLRAEKEIKFIEKKEIIPLFFTDEEYPSRLKNCDDGPVLLYTKGNMNLNAERIIAVVGSRNCTDYGIKICEQLISGFSSYDVLIVSGLAFGIDVCAHRSALSHHCSTVGVVAHGLDTLYPSQHKNIAERMLKNGGIVTEFMSETKMAPEYFPRRNRIIAGLADATIVVEATRKSGALITAEIANSYNRDVFAVPGRLDDSSSEGCNLLIRFNKASLIQSAEDVIRAMNWDTAGKKPKHLQQELFARLSAEEETLVNLLKQKEKIHVDALSIAAGYSMSKTAVLLLNLEFAGLVKSFPGKMYALSVR